VVASPEMATRRDVADEDVNGASPELRHVALTAGTLNYRSSGTGPPVVFLHGLFTNSTLWGGVIERLQDTHHCVAPDLPLGSHTHALGDGADLSPPGLAALVAEFLERLDLRDVTLVANDTGGAIAQLVAVRHPERLSRLVLTPCDAFDNFLPPMFRPLQHLARVPGLVGLMLQTLRLRPLRRLPIAYGLLTKRAVPNAVVDGWLRPAQRHRGVRRDVERCLRGIDARFTLEAAHELASFTKPVMLAWATEDRVFPPDHARRLAAVLPDARIEWIEDSYSFLPQDQPARLADVIRHFANAERG
jgi:pimeloyl-ACP methyl ester carboxylesterase